MKGVKFNPTPQQIQYLIDNYPNTLNAELAKHLGISMRTVARVASSLNLAKSQEFILERNRMAASATRLWHQNNPKPPGYRIPNSEKNLFRKGESITARYGEEKNQKAIAKRTASRKETVKKERRRILFGLPQRTKMRLTRTPQEKVFLRFYLRKKGYIVDEKKRIAFYTDTTQRGKRIERKQQPWYTFAPLPDNNH